MPESPGTETEKVCAVVVTFNRLAMLQECLAKLERQTRPPDAVIVVNNGSTDGTAEWLQSQAGLTAITQENVGSAGGNHAGTKRAHEEGFAWVWMLDDDLIVPPEALERLLAAARRANLDLINPLVAADTEPETLSFGLAPDIKTVAQAKAAARDGLIAGLANPFNGC